MNNFETASYVLKIRSAMYFQGAGPWRMSVAPKIQLYGFYEFRIFNIVSTRTRRLALFRVIWTQPTLVHFNYIRSTLTLSSHKTLGFLSGLFLSAFPTKTSYAFLFQLNSS